MNCPKQTKFRSGSILIEMMAALALLSIVAFALLRNSIDLIEPRQSILHQNLSDSYLTFEEALAARTSFDEIIADTTIPPATSPWPRFPAINVVNVTIGTLPGGRNITGTVTRTRIPDSNNINATDPDQVGTPLTNPAAMETWQLESHLTYTIGGQTYVKSRTMIRTQ